MNGYFLAFLAIALNAAAQLFLRSAMRPFRAAGEAAPNLLAVVPRLLLDWSFLGGMACYALSIGLWLAVLAQLPVSVVCPMQSVCYVIVCVSAYFICDEQINVMKSSGLAVIILGVILLARSGA